MINVLPTSNVLFRAGPSNMSEHTDCSVMDIEMDTDIGNAPLWCFEQARPLNVYNYNSVPDDFDDKMSYDITKWDNIDVYASASLSFRFNL